MQLTNKKYFLEKKKFLHKKLNVNILINFIDFFHVKVIFFFKSNLKKKIWIKGLN